MEAEKDDADHEGLAIDGPHGQVRLKWHKLRRRPEDFPFDLSNLRHAVSLGASCEVDLRRLADGSFACLHDKALDDETTGTGPVADIDGRTLTALRLRHPRTGTSGPPPPSLQDVAHQLKGDAVHAGALVQLDMKDDDPVPATALERFAAALDGVAHRFIASGMSWPPVAVLGEAVPSLRLGYDPFHFACEMRPDDPASFERFAVAVMETAPGAEVIYLPHQLLSQAATAGSQIVRLFRERGLSVDCWTLDPDHENIRELLPMAVEMGADQVTTNAPLALQRLWREICGG